MPVHIRTLAPTISVAGYRFALKENNVVETDWPWLRTSSNTHRLCYDCSRLNFPWLFTHALSAHTITIGAVSAKLSDGICLGLHKDISKRLHCQFCQLIIYALEHGADIEMLNQYGDWPQKEIWINNYFFDGQDSVAMVPSADARERTVRLGVRFKSGTEDNLIFMHGGRQVMIQRILETGDRLSPASGRALSRNSAGLVRMIKDWIQPCLLQGTTAIANSRDTSARIRLIDTQDQCIVGPLSSKRYTWGKIDPLVLLAQNEAELYRKGVLSLHGDRLPATIRDAISLCAQLGERYLWVDSLCIVQDTPDKHSQIQQMDRIYHNAAWCIIGAAGRDANAGLAGVTRHRDVPQRIVDVGGMCLANLVPPLTQSITQTFWQKRAWCFQEDLLSLHKVIFTSDQTYYHCQHGEYTEDTHGPAHNPSDLASVGLPWLFQMEHRSNWNIYCETIENYTGRMLSFETDVLNAFAGISAFLSTTIFAGCPLVMGIPICSLEAGLLWGPSGKLKRQTGTSFPSWSWAGWKSCGISSDFLSTVEYPRTQDHEKEFERTIRQVKWHVAGQEDLVTCIPKPSWEGWKNWTRVVGGDMDDIYYVHNKSVPRRKFAHPIVVQQWPSTPYSPLLRCTAEIARLTIISEHTDFWVDEGLCDDSHEVCHLKILDHSGHFAGVVTMDGMTFETVFKQASISQKEFCVMKISQTTFTDQGDPAWDSVAKTFAGKPGQPGINPQPAPPPLEEEFDYVSFDRNVCWCMYNVLVVNFDGDVATRLAVGRMYYTAFDDAKPKRKTFCLG